MLGRMLKTCLVAAALTFVATTPAFAQRMGGVNRNAPTVTQSIAFGTDSVEVTYTSISWAAGQWAAQLENEATKAKTREMINATAEKSPLGSLKCGVAIALGGQKVAAGTYKMAFTLDDKFKWQMVLTSDAGAITIPLDLKATDEESKRLVLGLKAGDKDFTADLGVYFGKSKCWLPVALQK